MKRLMKTTLAAGLLLTASTAFGQCRSFAKKKCMPTVQEDGFSFNGQMNNAILLPGDKADVMLTFYSGQEYRLLVCSQPTLGDVKFRLLDTSGSEVFSNEGKDINHLDFNVESTQQLVLSLEVPASSSSHDIISEGCVSVMIGYK